MLERFIVAFDKVVDGIGRIADNIWAFALFLLASVVALTAHHTADDKLLSFARDIALTGAALFHGKEKKD